MIPKAAGPSSSPPHPGCTPRAPRGGEIPASSFNHRPRTLAQRGHEARPERRRFGRRVTQLGSALLPAPQDGPPSAAPQEPPALSTAQLPCPLQPQGRGVRRAPGVRIIRKRSLAHLHPGPPPGDSWDRARLGNSPARGRGGSAPRGLPGGARCAECGRARSSAPGAGPHLRRAGRRLPGNPGRPWRFGRAQPVPATPGTQGRGQGRPPADGRPREGLRLVTMVGRRFSQFLQKVAFAGAGHLYEPLERSELEILVSPGDPARAVRLTLRPPSPGTPLAARPPAPGSRKILGATPAPVSALSRARAI